MSQRNKDLEPEGARQSHYIAWCSIIGIPDPCGPEYGYQRIVAIYIKYVMLGYNYTNKADVCSATARGYADSVNTLFDLRGYKLPANFSDPNNTVNILIANLKKEEDVA